MTGDIGDIEDSNSDNSGSVDAVDAVLAAFDDHLENGTARPTLDHLDPRDRGIAEELMRLMETGRVIDPSASAPSLEALLAGTEFAEALTLEPQEMPNLAPAPEDPDSAGMDRLRDVLSAVDSRADIVVDSKGFVCLTYLDLRVRFQLIEGVEPVVGDHTLIALFDADLDVDIVGIVAAGTPELITRVVSRYDTDATVTTAAGRPVLPPPPLPAVLAVRRILEDCAPEWGTFDMGRELHDDVVDVASLQVRLADQFVGQETRRRYRGDKALAYRSLVGHEHRLAALVATASRTAKRPLDLAAEVDRIARQVA